MPSNFSADDGLQHEFMLFVRGSTPATNAAVHQFRSFCAEHFESGRWILEIVDLQDSPEAATEHLIFATPTLTMTSGGRKQKLVGDFRDEDTLANALQLGVQENSVPNHA